MEQTRADLLQLLLITKILYLILISSCRVILITQYIKITMFFNPFKITIDNQLNKLLQNAFNVLKIGKYASQLPKKQLQKYTTQTLYQKELRYLLSGIEQLFKNYQDLKKISVNILVQCNIVQKGVGITVPDLILSFNGARNILKDFMKSGYQLQQLRSCLTFLQQADNKKWTQYQKKTISTLQKQDQLLLKQISSIKFGSQANDFKQLYLQQMSSTRKITELFDNIRVKGISKQHFESIKQIEDKKLKEATDYFLSYLKTYGIFLTKDSSFTKLFTGLAKNNLSELDLKFCLKQFPKNQLSIFEPTVKQLISLRIQNDKLKINSNNKLSPIKNPKELQNRFKQQLQQVQRSLQYKQEQCELLQKSNQQNKKKIEQLQKLTNNLNSKLLSLQTQNKKYAQIYKAINTAKINKIQPQPNKQSNQTISRLNKQIQQQKKKYEQACKQYGELFEQYEKLAEQKNHLQQKLGKIQSQNKKKLIQFEKDLSVITNQFQNQRKRNQMLSQELKKKQGNTSAKSKNQISIIEQQLSKERQQNQQLRESYQQLQQSLQKQQTQMIHKLKINQKNLKKNAVQLQNLCSQQQQINHKLVEQLRKIKQKLQIKINCQSQFTNLQKEYTLLQQQYSMMKEKEKDQLATQPSQNQHSSLHINQVQLLKQELSSKDAKINSIIQRVIANKERTITELQTNIIDLNKKVANLQKKIDLINEEERVE